MPTKPIARVENILSQSSCVFPLAFGKYCRRRFPFRHEEIVVSSTAGAVGAAAVAAVTAAAETKGVTRLFNSLQFLRQKKVASWQSSQPKNQGERRAYSHKPQK